MRNQCFVSSTNTENNNTETCTIGNYSTQSHVYFQNATVYNFNGHHSFQSQLHPWQLYCQLFGNKEFFFEAYPMEKKSDCNEALEKIVKDYGAPDSMIHDGAQKQVGPGTKF